MYREMLIMPALNAATFGMKTNMSPTSCAYVPQAIELKMQAIAIIKSTRAGSFV